jgi:hypothetical protein
MFGRVAHSNCWYDPIFKQSVVEEYQKGSKGRGLKALAKRVKFLVASSVKQWVEAYEGSVDSLIKKSGRGPQPAIPILQQEKLIKAFVKKKVE